MMKISRVDSFKRDYKRLMKMYFDMEKFAEMIVFLTCEDRRIRYVFQDNYPDYIPMGNMKGIRTIHFGKDWILTYRYVDGGVELLQLNKEPPGTTFKR